MITQDKEIVRLTSDEAGYLQSLLNQKGFDCGKPDGIVGKNTKSAWKRFKDSKYLGKTDWVGPASLKTLEEMPDNLTVNPSDIDWHNNNCKVSKYFTVGEVTQWDRRRIPTNSAHIQNILTLAKALDKIRNDSGCAIGVTSWYRPPAINAEVGGVSNSQHINGSAADIYPIGGDIYAFQKWLDKQWDKALGYGAKKGFVHVDLRDGRIRWDY